MCGITGFLQASRANADQLTDIVRAMADTIAHRGPDDRGEWCDADAGYAVGFRRLAIIDLSEAGHQPMVSASGRYVISFNGEIYNFKSIRKGLDEAGLSPVYRGHSDTEVMLAAIEARGLEKALSDFVGMFAFALWDRRERVLHLVRDRLGVKPLYYGISNGAFLFGSELKSFRRHPAFDGSIDRGALSLFLRHGYIPAPHSVYQSYRKLPPGSVLSIGAQDRQLPAPQAYWSARDVAREGVEDQFRGSEGELADDLDRILREVISMRMVADVPLGAFLSGGVDSSVVTAIMQSVSTRPVRTFTIGFNEKGYNEAEYARAVAHHLGTDHTELYVSSEEARNVIPKLPTLYDEPFADSSQIPTYLVSEMARRHVVVSLTGDGGDELFGGYNRYNYTAGIWRAMRMVPRSARRLAAAGLSSIPQGVWEKSLLKSSPWLPKRFRVSQATDKIAKLARILDMDGMEPIYHALVSIWRSPDSIVLEGREHATCLTDSASWPSLENATARMMYLDLVTYLPDDILVKVDRASMGVSLEAREPLLDHRLVEFAWRLPMSMKSRNGVGKWLLRQVLDRYVPRQLIERPKMGFGIPIGDWLRGPLRDWAESLLSEQRLVSERFFDPAPIRERWSSHLSGRRDNSGELWTVLMFQSWLEQNGGT